MRKGNCSSQGQWCLPAIIALLVLALFTLNLDSSGAVPRLGRGPGLTLDETFNVQMGVYLVRSIREYGLALLHPESVAEVFGDPAYNPDHPLLGRVIIGLAHELTFPFLDPDVPPGGICVTCGRIASVSAYALTVFLVGWVTARWSGTAAGAVAALTMLLMPRSMAHAHIASLETFVSLTYVGCVLWVADRWTRREVLRWRDVSIAGILFGLCLLTKIQGVLLPIPISVWALWRWRMKAVLPLIIFGLLGTTVFFVGWPWLWIDPVAHTREYFGRAAERQTLYCWYLGEKWADTQVPWHYAFILFAVTVPVGLHALGTMGVIASVRDRSAAPRGRPILILLNVIWPLVFFGLPGITVYDGTRLFLMVFPLWAIFVGTGGAWLATRIASRWSRHTSCAVVTLLLGLQAVGVIRMHPLGLSYYNAAIGGLDGAVRCGFEATYWADSITTDLLQEAARQVPREGELFVAPVLHPFQLQEILAQSPALREKAITLKPYDDAWKDSVRYVMVFRRRADSWDSLTPGPEGTLLAEVTRDGVQLSALYELD